jgi:hypothetical protein
MSERQKLFLVCVVDVAGMVLLLHFYPHYLVVGLSLGIGTLVVAARVWWRRKLRSPKNLHIPTPEPPEIEIEDEQLANYLWTVEFDEFTSDLLLDISIGDRTCKYNAHSPYIRCAVNPDVDTCEGCRHYEPLE